jgi:hypothetical protein
MPPCECSRATAGTPRMPSTRKYLFVLLLSQLLRFFGSALDARYLDRLRGFCISRPRRTRATSTLKSWEGRNGTQVWGEHMASGRACTRCLQRAFLANLLGSCNVYELVQSTESSGHTFYELRKQRHPTCHTDQHTATVDKHGQRCFFLE